MASIPNLNTFRNGRRGPRSRGRAGRAVLDVNDGSHEQSLEAGKDEIIQQTDHDASSSRMSAVSLGYLVDPHAIVTLPPGLEVSRRYPIINRGTYVRTTAIDQLVNRFLDVHQSQRKQIISLGSGSDTRFFRLCCLVANGDNTPQVVYHELDFESNINQKRNAIRRSKELSQQIKEAEKYGAELYTHAIDLRDLTFKSPPSLPNLEPELPTLLLSECCLCYLSPDTAASVLQYFTMHLKGPLGLILYEPIRPFDAFGKTMVSNLASRAIRLQTLQRYSSLEAQRQRLRLAGLVDGQGARDVYQLWQSDEWVSQSERERVERLEWLDEVEEWKLLASHYGVAWGWRGDILGEAWRDLSGSRTTEENRDEVG